MRNLLFFMLISLDGYFVDSRNELDWHNVDDEFNQFAIDQLDSVDSLLFGRVTYEMMASYWPTPQAQANDPVVAGKMNQMPKIVFSHTLNRVDWQNTRLVPEDAAAEVTRLKQQPGKDLIIFGSSDLATSLAEHGLIDEYRLLVNPLFLGGGKPVLDGLKDRLKLDLVRTKAFRNGNVLLTYQPEGVYK